MSRRAAHIASLVGAAASLVAAPAAAQAPDPRGVPGTGGDPVREELTEPAAVDTELPVLALEGGDPEDTVVFFDGFEVPWIFHRGGVRSIIPPGSRVGLDILPGNFGVEYGGGDSAVVIASRPGSGISAELTPLDATVSSASGRGSASLRVGWNRPLRGLRREDDNDYFDGIGQMSWRLARRWEVVASAITSSEDDRRFDRFVLATRYKAPAWRATLAISGMQQLDPEVERYSLDTRAGVTRTFGRVAGLANLQWRLGQQTTSAEWSLADGTRVTHDLAVWTTVEASLSRAINADIGVRVDSFDGDVATQPRARLLVWPRRDLVAGLMAGAYRRPPRQAAELLHDLNPERATEVALAAAFVPTPAFKLYGRAYYTDRTRLVAPDQLGVLHNTGVGASRGVELIARGTRGAWTGQLGMALTRSTRVDYLRAAEHPAAYEQPFRLDALASWKRGGLVLSARLRLASGLPYTPYPGAVYDSDTDTYDPLYVPPLSARTPFHHQIDLRADYRKRLGDVYLDAFLDLHNVYRNEDAIGYAYSFDYSTGTAITALPLFPFVGLRLTL